MAKWFKVPDRCLLSEQCFGEKLTLGEFMESQDPSHFKFMRNKSMVAAILNMEGVIVEKEVHHFVYNHKHKIDENAICGDWRIAGVCVKTSEPDTPLGGYLEFIKVQHIYALERPWWVVEKRSRTIDDVLIENTTLTELRKEFDVKIKVGWQEVDEFKTMNQKHLNVLVQVGADMVDNGCFNNERVEMSLQALVFKFDMEDCPGLRMSETRYDKIWHKAHFDCILCKHGVNHSFTPEVVQYVNHPVHARGPVPYPWKEYALLIERDV